MTHPSDEQPDPTRPDVGWEDPQPADQQHPDSAFPGAGERVSDEKVAEALDAFPPNSPDDVVANQVDGPALD